MQFVQDANRHIKANVATMVGAYSLYTSALRGIAIGLLTGIGNGTKSFLAMNRELHAARQSFLDSIEQHVGETVARASLSAIDAVSRGKHTDTRDSEMAVADTLSRGFANDMMARADEQSKRDVRTVENYLRKQLTQGRHFVGSQEIEYELQFAFADRSGREIKSDDYLRREFNWAVRQLFNYLVIHGLIERGEEYGLVSGGSKNGVEFSLAEYDKYLSSVFHHNSTALVSPIDNYSVT